jgi:hypothetical protein
MDINNLKIIITGVTGMVGEGVLHECLNDVQVAEVLVINRRPCGMVHPKLKEILHDDFFDIAPILSQITGYDACYFCLGVSSIGMKEPEYYNLTYKLTLIFATALSSVNSNMVFCYVSGASTDSTEKGKIMWARVKGKTENDLLKLPFKQVYNFRPGYLHPTPGLQRTHKFYKYISWLYPLMRKIMPNSVSSLRELGLAMLAVTKFSYDKYIIEVRDIIALAKIKR